MSKIIFISGPSGMAKTRVKEKFEGLAATMGLRFERVIVATSREIRPNESQGNPWYFRSVAEINANYEKDPERYLKVEVRKGEFQGLDAETELKQKLETGDVLWCELQIRWSEKIEKWLKEHVPGVTIVKVFVAPLTESEVLEKAAEKHTTWEKIIEEEVLRRLLARRAANLDNASDEKIHERAQDAVRQYALRHQYDCIIVNHQGEESLEWGSASEFPTGEAARVLEQFLCIYKA